MNLPTESISASTSWKNDPIHAAARARTCAALLGPGKTPESLPTGTRPSFLTLVLGLLLLAASILPFPAMTAPPWARAILLLLSVSLLWLFAVRWRRSSDRPDVMRPLARGFVRTGHFIRATSSPDGRFSVVRVLLCGDDRPDPDRALFKDVVSQIRKGKTMALAALRDAKLRLGSPRRPVPKAVAADRELFVADLVVMHQLFEPEEDGEEFMQCLVEPGPSGAVLFVAGTGKQRPAPPAPEASKKASFPCITLLRTKPPTSDLAAVSAIFESIWGAGTETSKVEGNERIDGMLASHEAHGICSVSFSRVPYVPPNALGAWAAAIPNEQASRLAMMHSSFISIDFVFAEDQNPEHGDMLVRRVAAAFLDADTVLLLDPPSGLVVVPNERTAAELVDPDADLFPRLYTTPGDEPTMVGAMKEARARWPEFVAAWAERDPEKSMFSVKARFESEVGTEHIWLNPTAIDPDGVTGIVANKPAFQPHLAKDDTVTVPVSRVSDWFFVMNGRAEGYFTEPHLRAAFTAPD